MEWPKGSGVIREFPEVDRAAWFSLADARRKLLKGQLPLLDELEKMF
jgi:predicted NUDIX family NTP pyrophosphohydrolase